MGFKVVKQSAGEVTVAMSFKDDFAYSAAPGSSGGSTGIEATYYVTLKAGRAALDARVVLKNPSDKTIPYEYWTCTTLAPGSDPNNPKTTGGAEIIAPIQAYSTPPGRANISEGDASAGAAKAVSKNCATSGTGRRWASPTRRRTCRAAISGA